MHEKMLSKINKTDSCWLWTGKPNQNGYGRLRINKKTVLAHRLAYELWVGTIPLDKPNVLHHCDNPPCVNPEHLFVGTQADNIKDMVAKGRNISPQALKTHCPSGHEYNKINTRIKSNNHRICKVCDRNRKKETSACKRYGIYI